MDVRMSKTNDPVYVMNKFLLNYMRNVHTIKPALVKKVVGNRISAAILTKTRYADDYQQPFPDVNNVPLMVYSGGLGTSRVTVPVSVGDMVLILFSDRDLGGLMLGSGKTPAEPDDIKTHEYHPVMAIPCMFSLPNEKPIEPGKIVIESGVSRVAVGLDGVVEITAPVVNITAPVTNIIGNIVHTGEYTQNGIPMSTHKHVSASPGNPTGVPQA